MLWEGRRVGLVRLNQRKAWGRDADDTEMPLI